MNKTQPSIIYVVITSADDGGEGGREEYNRSENTSPIQTPTTWSVMIRGAGGIVNLGKKNLSRPIFYRDTVV